MAIKEQLERSTDVKDKSRIFFVGEIFWTMREAWRTTSFGKNPDKLFRPVMVLKKSFSPHPVVVAPGTTKQQKDDLNKVFIPSQKFENKYSGKSVDGYFILYMRRPVDREYISNYIATISGKEKQALAEMLRKMEV